MPLLRVQTHPHLRVPRLPAHVVSLTQDDARRGLSPRRSVLLPGQSRVLSGPASPWPGHAGSPASCPPGTDASSPQTWTPHPGTRMGSPAPPQWPVLPRPRAPGTLGSWLPGGNSGVSRRPGRLGDVVPCHSRMVACVRARERTAMTMPKGPDWEGGTEAQESRARRSPACRPAEASSGPLWGAAPCAHAMAAGRGPRPGSASTGRSQAEKDHV